MEPDIEKLLRLTADYHNFCKADFAKAKISDSDELSLEALDLIAAATGFPMEDLKKDAEKNAGF